MKVWVLFDAMNEEVLGVFTSEEHGEEAAIEDPQAGTWLHLEEFDLNIATKRGNPQ